MHACVLTCNSHVLLFATPWTVARQAPLLMVFSRQEYWSGLPCHPGIQPASLMSLALASGFFTTSASWEALKYIWILKFYICQLKVKTHESCELSFIWGKMRTIAGVGNGNSLQYPCLGNPMDTGDWRLQSMGSRRVEHNWVIEYTCKRTVTLETASQTAQRNCCLLGYSSHSAPNKA